MWVVSCGGVVILLFGSVNGHRVAKVLTTGVVTIPLMKRSGFKPEEAAAVEATASNGGQMMPPVMGAVAFLMADFLQISYAEVAIAALVPSLLYYIALFIPVSFTHLTLPPNREG